MKETRTEETRTGSIFTYERGDLVLTPLGKGTIITDPDGNGNCTVELTARVRERRITATTFQFTSILKKWNEEDDFDAPVERTSNKISEIRKIRRGEHNS